MAQRSLFSTEVQQANKSWDAGFLTHAEVAKRFEEFDRDGDGFITVAECRAAMDRLGREISQGIVQDNMFAWDSDHDGIVDYFEFMDYFLTLTPPSDDGEAKQFDSIEALLHHCVVKDGAPIASNLTRQAKAELIKSFKLMDLDGDGFISPEEMTVALRGMSPDTPKIQIEAVMEKMFKAADRDSNGLIDLYEFSSRAVQEGLYS
jgi:calcium-binding protein CML